MMQDTMVPMRRNRAYTILVDVEFLHPGQAAQQRLQAALPQQHAREPIIQPISD